MVCRKCQLCDHSVISFTHTHTRRYTATDLAMQVLQNEEFKNEVLSRTPMRRIGTPDEVAGVKGAIDFTVSACLCFCLPLLSE